MTSLVVFVVSSGVLVRGKESLTGALYAADWGIKCPIPAARWYHLEELRSQLHTGDVVLFRSRTITAMFRARLHGEVFSHCGIVVVLKVLGAAPHPVWLSHCHLISAMQAAGARGGSRVMMLESTPLPICDDLEDDNTCAPVGGGGGAVGLMARFLFLACRPDVVRAGVHVVSLRHRLESHEWCYAAVRQLQGLPGDVSEVRGGRRHVWWW